VTKPEDLGTIITKIDAEIHGLFWSLLHIIKNLKWLKD
jgi:hypothetical protein